MFRKTPRLTPPLYSSSLNPNFINKIMTTQKEQWYEVLRHDGVKQYATKDEKGYLLYGSGFFIKEFDAVSVTPVEEIPNVKVSGHAYFEDSKRFKAIHNPNHRWNGWAMPYIHHSAVKAVCKLTSWDGQKVTLNKEGIVTIQQDGEDPVLIEPVVINGEIYYYFGNEGWCWEFKANKS